MTATSSPCFFFFSLVSSCFYTPQLCQSMLCESKGGPSHSAMNDGGGGCSLHHSHEENSSVAGKFPLGLEQCWLEERDEAVCFFFLFSYSEIFELETS